MTIPPEYQAVAAGLRDSVPFVRTLGLVFEELSAERAVLRLPDEPAHRNHVGGPHAGAMFTVAESASGAVVLASFGHLLDRATPLPVNAQIHFRKIALGPMVAEAVLGRPAAEVIAELDAGSRPEFPVEVELRTEDGTPTGSVTVVWTLRPNRRD
ncbi:DUF4442 domain-containing protein [Allostreptomyces psammosilenae]|uniref:Acyl-coenzyme A thioesterase PaaI-like protein n=1 Tax=Allostreptomyces psammosilenae TaxID=1892865 RepID=A0A853A3T5_9ACTN|nr:DUF4442 domain-containing protein [Allostreptomyces psammosilenae]NYI05148.1 acyl-coenzyme A thioesterase PaaI-like protein [Allostreptomyces psammosilenae]